MATAKKATEEETKPEQVETLTARSTALALENQQLKQAATLSEKQVAATADMHKAEVLRLQEIIERSQKASALEQTHIHAGARAALRTIIAELASVAEGAAVTDLRRKVYSSATELSYAEKTTLIEYISRLHGATEAVKQESAMLLV